MSFPSYNERKPSGVDWLGPVPSHWSIQPLLSVARERFERNLGQREANLLSLSYGRIVRKDINSNEGLLPESFETYQIVHGGDLVWRLTDLQNDQRSLRTALAEETGIITSAYLATEPLAIDASYFSYLVRAYDLHKVFYSMGGGLRQSMRYGDVKRLPVLVPPFSEQRQIASFLDGETAKIDGLVAQQQRLIELLQEKRQAVISHAVTKGLDPTAQMKDSGVEWLGEVPTHWKISQLRHLAEVMRGKFSHRPRNDPAFYNGPFPFIQTGNITGADKRITTYEQTLNERGAAVSKEFPRGTLVMAIAANIGDVAVLDFPAYFPDSIVGLLPVSGCDLMFLYYLMASLKQPMLMTATISTQMNLNVDQIVSLTAACPPLHEQVAIVSYLDQETSKIDALVREAAAAITFLQERRTALISAAVTGKIDVRHLAMAAAEAA